MSKVIELHDAIERGDIARLRTLLAEDRTLANRVSETDARGTYALHVAAEFGQAEAALVLLEHGADVALRESENDAIALGWAAFFGRPGVVRVLLDAGSEVSQKNAHGLTPLKCAVEGAAGRWQKLSNAKLEAWQEAAEMIRECGGIE